VAGARGAHGGQRLLPSDGREYSLRGLRGVPLSGFMPRRRVRAGGRLRCRKPLPSAAS